MFPTFVRPDRFRATDRVGLRLAVRQGGRPVPRHRSRRHQPARLPGRPRGRGQILDHADQVQAHGRTKAGRRRGLVRLLRRVPGLVHSRPQRGAVRVAQRQAAAAGDFARLHLLVCVAPLRSTSLIGQTRATSSASTTASCCDGRRASARPMSRATMRPRCCATVWRSSTFRSSSTR